MLHESNLPKNANSGDDGHASEAAEPGSINHATEIYGCAYAWALLPRILLAAPFIFYFIGQFVMPALKIKEKKYFLRAFAIGVGLFVMGVCFCYFIIMPRALKFAELFALWMGIKVPEWRAETYFGFVTKFMLGMGLGFELPVVLLALVKIGILDYKKLSTMRRYSYVFHLYA